MSTVDTEPSLASQIPVVGIVGGVGSGKSSVARKLAELAPVAIIEADKLGHQALELPEVKAKLRQRFGNGIFNEEGEVVRSRLAALVFGDSPETIAARTELESITHPEIGRLTEEEVSRHRREGKVRWIILDAALLLEAGWRTFCDAIVFVDVTPERRLQQVQHQRGWSAEEWQRREASQWRVESKRAAADIIINNNVSLDDAGRELLAALSERVWGRTN